MKQSLFILLLFLFFSCNKKKSSNPESNTNDSLVYYSRILSNDKKSFELKSETSKKAILFAEKKENSKAKREALLSVITFQVLNQDYFRFDFAYKTLLENSIAANDSVNIANAYRFKASYLKNNAVYDSAFYFYGKSEKIFKNLNDEENLGNILLNKSVTQYFANDFLKADLTATKAYNILKNQDDKYKIYVILTILGNINSELNEYEKALEYYKKGLETIEKNNIDNNQHPKATSLNNIGHIYKLQKKYNEAITYFNLALENRNIIKDTPDLYVLLLDNLAYCKFKVKDYSRLPEMFLESLKISDSLKLYSSSIYSLNHLSEYYAANNDYENARKCSERAISLSKMTKLPVDLLSALKQGSLVFPSEESKKLSQDYIRINDSLQQTERKSQEKFAKIQLETDEIIQEKEGLAEKNRNLLYVFVVSFILVVLLFVVRAQRARTRELLYKQAQQKANEDIYNLMMSQQAIIDESRSKEKKRLAQDLHDGVLGRMFGLRLNLDSLNSSTDEEAVQRRFELLNELKTIEQDIREISHDLNREKQVLINNFVSIVHNLLEEQKNAFEANVNYAIDDTINWDKIGNTIKINLYRILQEGLQNINKYANAKNIWVEISGNAESVSLTIQDDGIGFDVNRKSKGIGMQNMISRTHDCKGIIDIQSKKDQGTKIIITVPIETKQPETITQE
ncbi:tetratricopeptide repeat-containing sensor histidine kinase [Flavobacterium sedimenticola]|uniref:histidine kinase n=1 Tax=Flavobacterium sedimenticola TaxID=3043286 RepID=A0ABT6XLY9_9FLAO|nr:tetratricopeptide repeat-containing sensor histidine kinase [Flavobacterium sedimenticola]MDI9255990.1 tetratricopeptide repeat protein [Flavobacterium sedimenticola]